MDVSRLIQAVRGRRPLWDRKHAFYHDRVVTMGLWVEVAGSVDTDPDTARAKWKGLRDTFRGELRKVNKFIASGASSKSTNWEYFDEMLFVKDQIYSNKLLLLNLICIMELIPKRRKKMESRRWTQEHKNKLLSIILEEPLKFERPTARIYYHKILTNNPEFSEYGWISMRDKLRNLKVKYTKAIDWRRNTGSGLQVDDPETTIREYILKICPEFDLMDNIFGTRKNIDVTYNYDSEIIPKSENFDGEDLEAHQSPLSISIAEAGTLVPEPYTSLSGPSSPEPEGSTPVHGRSTPVPADEVASWNEGKHTKNALSFLAEAQTNKTLFLEKKIAMEEKFNILKLELERERLALERERLALEKEKCQQEFKLKEIELKNNFEIQKLKLIQEKELRMRSLAEMLCKASTNSQTPEEENGSDDRPVLCKTEIVYEEGEKPPMKCERIEESSRPPTIPIANPARTTSSLPVADLVQPSNQLALNITEHNQHQNTHLTSTDDDYNFLMSILPQLRSLPTMRNLFVRLKIQELLYNEIITLRK